LFGDDDPEYQDDISDDSSPIKVETPGLRNNDNNVNAATAQAQRNINNPGFVESHALRNNDNNVNAEFGATAQAQRKINIPGFGESHALRNNNNGNNNFLTAEFGPTPQAQRNINNPGFVEMPNNDNSPLDYVEHTTITFEPKGVNPANDYAMSLVEPKGGYVPGYTPTMVMHQIPRHLSKQFRVSSRQAAENFNRTSNGAPSDQTQRQLKVEDVASTGSNTPSNQTQRQVHFARAPTQHQVKVEDAPTGSNTPSNQTQRFAYAPTGSNTPSNQTQRRVNFEDAASTGNDDDMEELKEFLLWKKQRRS
jgi:hypothetical protein